MNPYVALVVAMLYFYSDAYAQSVCGEAPVVTDDYDRAQLEGSANETVAAGGGVDEFTQRLEADRIDIFSRYSQGERAIAYYQYIVCRVIENDESMPSSIKIDELNRAFSALFIKSPNSYAAYSFLVLNKYDESEMVVRSVLRQDGNVWNEVQLDHVQFTFTEVDRTSGYIHLIDSRRSLELKVPIEGGVSMIRYTGQAWQSWNVMHPDTK